MEQEDRPYRVLTQVNVQGALIVPGSDVELKDGDFLRVKQILRNRLTRTTFVRGLLMQRHTRHRVLHLRNLLPRALNELCIVLRGVDPECKDLKLDDYLVDVPVESVSHLRNVVFTNRVSSSPASRCGAMKFDDLSFRDEMKAEYFMMDDCGKVIVNHEYVSEHAVLVARWKSVQYTGKQGDKGYMGALVRLREHESDAGKGIPDAALVYWFRELALYGKVPVAAPPQHLREMGTSTRTYCDICAGAGGVAAGVRMAKANDQTFEVRFCLDHCPAACETLRLNFPEAEILETGIHEWCTAGDGKDYRVTVAHISFPCKPWSWAHTVPGQHDEANMATVHSIKAILLRLRARHITYENTDGMTAMSNKHEGIFSSQIHECTDLQYSVRWQIVDSAKHGSAQKKRARLIVFASAPGEPLAHFAPSRPGARTTIGDVLSNTNREIEPHMQATMPMSGAPHDPSQPLPHAFTCSASPGTHPDGDRGYNMQECAQLAGFTWFHRFANVCKTKLMELIGNAVPSATMQDQYLMIHKSLNAGDTEMRAWLATRNQGPIELDDDDDFEMLDADYEIIAID